MEETKVEKSVPRERNEQRIEYRVLYGVSLKEATWQHALDRQLVALPSSRRK